MLLPSGNPFKCHEEVLYFQLLIPPKRFDIFSPLTGGCSEGLGAFRFFFKHLTVVDPETLFMRNSKLVHCPTKTCIVQRKIRTRLDLLSFKEKSERT